MDMYAMIVNGFLRDIAQDSDYEIYAVNNWWDDLEKFGAVNARFLAMRHGIRFEVTIHTVASYEAKTAHAEYMRTKFSTVIKTDGENSYLVMMRGITSSLHLFCSLSSLPSPSPSPCDFCFCLPLQGLIPALSSPSQYCLRRTRRKLKRRSSRCVGWTCGGIAGHGLMCLIAP